MMLAWTSSERKLQELIERVELLERTNKNLVLEWEEMYDKFRRLLGRISKRQEALEKAEAGPPAAPRTNDSTDPAQLPLTDDARIAELNRRIRLNRSARAVPPNGNG